MMKKYLIAAMILGCAIGCKQSEKNSTATVILVDLEKMHKIDIHGEYAKPICLTENGNLALIDEVKKVLFVEDQYIIQCKKNVLAFDAQTGEQKMSFSGKGRAKAEFIALWDTWLEGNAVCMYDINGKKILRYDLNGDLSDVISVTNEAINSPFQVVAKLGEDYYVGKRMYSGIENTELSLYNKNFEFIKEIGDMKIESGIYLGYPFFVNGPSEVLYYRYLYNDIYSIDDKQNIRVKYYIDFGEKNLPLHPNLKDEYDRIDFVNKSEKKYASLVSNIYESDKYFCFSFVFDGEKCLGVYEKSSGRTAAFTFTSSAESSRADVCVYNNKALLVTQDMDKTCLTTIKVEDLLKGR